MALNSDALSPEQQNLVAAIWSSITSGRLRQRSIYRNLKPPQPAKIETPSNEAKS